MAITTWKKFYFISGPYPDDQNKMVYPQNPIELSLFLEKNKEPLWSTPQNSPISGILDKISQKGGPNFTVHALPPQQLMLELVKESKQFAIMPEPFITSTIMKNPKLKIIGNLEEEYGKFLNGPQRLPQAGIAINQNFLKNEPLLAQQLLESLNIISMELINKPANEIAELLPKETHEALGTTVITNSLSRDPVLVKIASEVKDEIFNFLSLTIPELFSNGSISPDFPATFIYQKPF
jgi:NitT/TauT family transport system substrate-binding protein